MKRNLLTIMTLSSFGLAAQAAIPITSYEATAVEIPQEYAVQGGYWGLALGYNIVSNQTIGVSLVRNSSNDDLISFPDMVVTSKKGVSAQLTSGYRIYRWRFEGELGYRLNRAFDISNVPESTDPNGTFLYGFASGGTSVISLMVNVTYDRYFQSGWMWILGGGIGGAHINYFSSFSTPPAGSPELDFTNSNITFAVQGIAGVGYTWSDHIETAITFRYFRPFSSRYDVENDFISGQRFQFNPQYNAQTINLEMRFT